MKSIALVSGGLDSLVSLAMARKDSDVVLALNFDYGQKAAARESKASEEIAKYYNIPYRQIKLDWMSDITQTALVNKKMEIPKIDELMMERQLEITQESAKAVWVPNRNGVFVNIAASFAETMKADLIIAGFNSEEAATFPDNSLQFVNYSNQLFRVSTLSKPKLISYMQSYNKSGIVNIGFTLKVPFNLIYSCYNSSKTGKMCGGCESCSRLKRAFKKASKYDLIIEKFADEEQNLPLIPTGKK